MLKTYSFYFRDGPDGVSSFEPVMCASEVELMERAREALAGQPDFEGLDVFFGDTELFRLRQRPSN